MKDKYSKLAKMRKHHIIHLVILVILSSVVEIQGDDDPQQYNDNSGKQLLAESISTQSNNVQTEMSPEGMIPLLSSEEIFKYNRVATHQKKQYYDVNEDEQEDEQDLVEENSSSRITNSQESFLKKHGLPLNLPPEIINSFKPQEMEEDEAMELLTKSSWTPGSKKNKNKETQSESIFPKLTFQKKESTGDSQEKENEPKEIFGKESLETRSNNNNSTKPLQQVENLTEVTSEKESSGGVKPEEELMYIDESMIYPYTTKRKTSEEESNPISAPKQKKTGSGEKVPGTAASEENPDAVSEESSTVSDTDNELSTANPVEKSTTAKAKSKKTKKAKNKQKKKASSEEIIGERLTQRLVDRTRSTLREVVNPFQ